MNREAYGRKYSHQPQVKMTDILDGNEGVFVDTNFFANPLFVLNPRYLYLGGKNIIRLIMEKDWNRLHPSMIYSATNEFAREADLFISEYGKIRTVEMVVKEWEKFSRGIDDAITSLPNELKEHSKFLKELKKLRLASDYIKIGLTRAKIESNQTINSLSSLFGLFKSIPLDKFERKKLKDGKHTSSADQDLLAAATYESVFRDQRSGIITRDRDLYKMMSKGSWFFTKVSTPFTRHMMKRGPRIYHCTSGDQYDTFTFKNCKPAHLPKDAFQRLNGNLDALVSQLTAKYEERP